MARASRRSWLAVPVLEMPSCCAERASRSSVRRAYPVALARVIERVSVIPSVARHYPAIEAYSTAQVGIEMAIRRGLRTIAPVDPGHHTQIPSYPRFTRAQLANPPKFFPWKLSITALCFAFFSDMTSFTCDYSDPTVQKVEDLPSPRWRLWNVKR